MGVPQNALQAIAEAAPKDHCHGTNPRKPTVAEYRALLDAAWIA
jgi:alcohol dehydrogenase class IV